MAKSQLEATSKRANVPALLSRRKAVKALAAAGIGTPVFQRALAAQAEASDAVTIEMVKQAEWISGLELTEEQRKQAASSLTRARKRRAAIDAVELENSVAPAIHFFPVAPHPTMTIAPRQAPPVPLIEDFKRPASSNDLAFASIPQLATLLRTKQLASVELTKLCLERLRRLDPVLHCVVNLTEATALEQAEQADREFAEGKDRGPLHGIPWGAKDLISYPGYPTTWGAPQYREQKLESKATVAKRLEDAGAVLVAKLTLGALAQGDLWFGGMTRNPWNPEEGSSGSSAGSCSAVAAGLIPFAIGSETLGSIVSPCRRCGTSGLRPTFGRISRFGCMALSWSMDKLGPIARSMEDCALVFAAIHGADGLDACAVDRPFAWPATRDVKEMNVGYFNEAGKKEDREELQTLEKLGVNLVPIELPSGLPAGALTVILSTEAATVFEDLARRGIVDGLNSWPETFRMGQFVTAVEYLRANRVRTLLMRRMEELMVRVDAYVGGDDLVMTNLTGHPTVVFTDGFEERGGAEVPRSIKFTGRLYGESDLLALAKAYQEARGFHRRRPTLDRKKQT